MTPCFDDAYEAQLQLLDISKIKPTERQRREADSILRQLIDNAIEEAVAADEED